MKLKVVANFMLRIKFRAPFYKQDSNTVVDFNTFEIYGVMLSDSVFWILKYELERDLKRMFDK